MSESVKRRAYNSPRRRAQAEATRRDILDAAKRLFERNGYAATTISGIAAEASVAPKTVQLAFETKSGVLRALWNLLLRGGQDEARIDQQPWYREVLDEQDPERQLLLNARNSRRAKDRIAATLIVIRGAATTDPDIGALWNRIQTEYHANQGVVVASLNEKHALPSGLSVERATDILWTVNHPNVWQLFVGERGWTADEYEQWCAETASAQLLKR
ncbi:MAG: TetR/AcrR family transcriptional regulator [Actinobacteria bacterium]|nr:TetR/AcrR family transcriptional regulator [Actinomycetota bacterium]